MVDRHTSPPGYNPTYATGQAQGQPARPMTQDELRAEAYKYRDKLGGYTENKASSNFPLTPYMTSTNQLHLLQLETINHAIKLHHIISNLPTDTPVESLSAHMTIERKLQELIILIRGRNAL